jgi:hypothetical protein
LLGHLEGHLIGKLLSILGWERILRHGVEPGLVASAAFMSFKVDRAHIRAVESGLDTAARRYTAVLLVSLLFIELLTLNWRLFRATRGHTSCWLDWADPFLWTFSNWLYDYVGLLVVLPTARSKVLDFFCVLEAAMNNSNSFFVVVAEAYFAHTRVAWRGRANRPIIQILLPERLIRTTHRRYDLLGQADLFLRQDVEFSYRELPIAFIDLNFGLRRGPSMVNIAGERAEAYYEVFSAADMLGLWKPSIWDFWKSHLTVFSIGIGQRFGSQLESESCETIDKHAEIESMRNMLHIEHLSEVWVIPWGLVGDQLWERSQLG